VLVEFFAGQKLANVPSRFSVVEKRVMKAFNAPFDAATASNHTTSNTTSTSAGATKLSSLMEWDAGYISNMRDVLSKNYSSGAAEAVFTRIMDTANGFLRYCEVA
jgi:hypothetical protein